MQEPLQQSFPQPNTAVSSHSIDDELIIFDDRSKQLTRLNQTASKIWCLHAEHNPIESIAEYLSEHYDIATHQLIPDIISALEISTYMRNQLLRDSDVTSMAWGLELRVPFVDQQLFEQVSDIPAAFRLRMGKQLLIDAVPEIPEWVVSRPKQGFRFPFDLWFADQWQDILLKRPAPNWIKLRPWYRRWSLVVLDNWLARYAK